MRPLVQGSTSQTIETYETFDLGAQTPLLAASPFMRAAARRR
jgi:hypothetical protein